MKPGTSTLVERGCAKTEAITLLHGHRELGTTNTATRTEGRAARPQRGGSGIRTWFSLEALLKSLLENPWRSILF